MLDGPRLLRGYLRANGIRVADLRRAVSPPVTVQAVYQWLWGTRRPSPAYRAQLTTLTGGAVPLDAWLSRTERTRAAWLAQTGAPDDARR